MHAPSTVGTLHAIVLRGQTRSACRQSLYRRCYNDDDDDDDDDDRATTRNVQQPTRAILPPASYTRNLQQHTSNKILGLPHYIFGSNLRQPNGFPIVDKGFARPAPLDTGLRGPRAYHRPGINHFGWQWYPSWENTN